MEKELYNTVATSPTVIWRGIAQYLCWRGSAILILYCIPVCRLSIVYSMCRGDNGSDLSVRVSAVDRCVGSSFNIMREGKENDQDSKCAGMIFRIILLLIFGMWAMHVLRLSNEVNKIKANGQTVIAEVSMTLNHENWRSLRCFCRMITLN